MSPNYQTSQQNILQNNNNNVSPPMTVVEDIDDEVAKLTKDQSQKFFYQQFLDCNDILAALIIVVVLRSFSDNIVSDLDSHSYYLFIYESGVELFLDVIFTMVAYFLVPKCKYQVYSISNH